MRYPRETTYIMPQLSVPDITRGEERLAAEVALDLIEGREVSPCAAYRARDVLERMAGEAA